jgi:hypothetical protein
LGISIFISDAVVLGGDDSLFLGIDGPVTINLGRDGVLTIYNHILDYHQAWQRLYVSINGRRLRPSRLVVVGRLIADVTLESVFYGVGILKPEDATWVERLVAKASGIANQAPERLGDWDTPRVEGTLDAQYPTVTSPILSLKNPTP